MVWFDARCLTDLARTRDEELYHLNRRAWALLIVGSFPIGPMVYLLFGKGPSDATHDPGLQGTEPWPGRRA